MIALENEYRADLLAAGVPGELPERIQELINTFPGLEILPGPILELEKAMAESAIDVGKLGRRLLVRSFLAFDEGARSDADDGEPVSGFMLAARCAAAAASVLSKAKGKDARDMRGEALCSLSSSLARLSEMGGKLGSVDQSPDAEDLLDRAVEAGEDAADAFGENRAGWARAQCVLADALRLLAICIEFDAEEEEIWDLRARAVRVASSATGILTMEDSPREWARIQSFMALVGLELAETRDYEDDEFQLLCGVEATQSDALEVLDSGTDPLDWAVAQEQLGLAKLTMAELDKLDDEENRELMEGAAKAYKSALAHKTRDDEPERWARNHVQLATALVGQAGLSSAADAANLYHGAVAACEAALEVYTPADFKGHYFSCKFDLGDALVRLADLDDVDAPRELLERGLQSYEQAMQVAGKDNADRDLLQDSIDGVKRKLAALDAGR